MVVLKKCLSWESDQFHMPRLSQCLSVIFLLLSLHSESHSLSLHTASHESYDGTLIIGRSTGIPGMFGRFIIILNGRVLGMIGENQVIKKKLPYGPYILTIRDDVKYRNFADTTVRFSIESNQKKLFLITLEQKAFDPKYRIVAKELKKD